MAILPPAKPTARSLPSIAGSYEIGGRLPPDSLIPRGDLNSAAILRGMGDPDRRRRSRSGRLLDALIWGTALGAASGAVLGDAIDGVGAGLGALVGAALYAPAEVITTIRRGPAEPKPLWYRIISSALLMSVFGWLLGLIYDEPLFIAI